jgi:hypothetical protein
MRDLTGSTETSITISLGHMGEMTALLKNMLDP